MVGTNCYLIYHVGTKQGVIVDPGDSFEIIKRECDVLDLKVEGILLTHGHADHILAVDELKQEYRCKVYAGKAEKELLGNPLLNLSTALVQRAVSVEPDVLVTDGEKLQLAGFTWMVIETPGHTVGCVCYYIESGEVLVSGDTLFANSLGRTDLPTANPSEIIKSIANKLFPLPEETMVYPGHGEPTSIGHEKVYNPVAEYIRR